MYTGAQSILLNYVNDIPVVCLKLSFETNVFETELFLHNQKLILPQKIKC